MGIGHRQNRALGIGQTGHWALAKQVIGHWSLVVNSFVPSLSLCSMRPLRFKKRYQL
ncbi:MULTISPECIES: hypothetical protein [unclassified Microcoleus]|uniref:hypothetical protein n=1 Tax=unclassified Microcoleus TaxID=2642155 RepID=UPI002FD47F98